MRINSANDASILCENFIKFCSVTPELTQLICEVMYDMAKKLAYFFEYHWTYWTDFRYLFTT